MLLVVAWLAAALYAVVRSVCAWSATASAAWVVPLTVPGGKPEIAVPGLTPRSPVSTEEPVFVTLWPARTAKLPAVPRSTAVAAALALPGTSASTRTSTPRVKVDIAMAEAASPRLRRAVGIFKFIKVPNFVRDFREGFMAEPDIGSIVSALEPY
jgi:hypothetical protein